MALTTCPDCEKSVSERAPTCPHCGAPIALAPSGAPSYRPVVPIEQTGKRWKAMRLYGVGLVLLSPIPVVAGGDVLATLGILSFVGGLGLMAYASFGAWWYHG